MTSSEPTTLTGGCLCGGVRYQIIGPRRDIINCHCENCRRTHGHIAAYTSVRKSDLDLTNEQTLQWYHDESPDTWRGFCNRCGASLFWDARDGRDKMSVAAGSLDDSGELQTIGHVFVSEAGQYYEISDGLPQFETGNDGVLEDDSSS
ncbi:MAG: GFA family protein [Gammaproteobacteria bacterium]|nr:MAG: GFA family protein [Gammaproteobacteria bacterium]UCH38992.1 MAG: GFA family protein [Gammaproteobacteria bacterium]